MASSALAASKSARAALADSLKALADDSADLLDSRSSSVTADLAFGSGAPAPSPEVAIPFVGAGDSFGAAIPWLSTIAAQIRTNPFGGRSLAKCCTTLWQGSGNRRLSRLEDRVKQESVGAFLCVSFHGRLLEEFHDFVPA